MKYLLVLVVLATSIQAEVFSDRQAYEDALPPGLKQVHERFKGKKWVDTYQSNPFDVPQISGPITRARVAWGTPDLCLVTGATEGRGNALVTNICGQPIGPDAGYDVAAKGGRLICAFGADFNTWAGVANSVTFTLDSRVLNDDDLLITQEYQFFGFIDESCGTNLRVEVNNEGDDGFYNFRTRDALIGRTP